MRIIKRSAWILIAATLIIGIVLMVDACSNRPPSNSFEYNGSHFDNKTIWVSLDSCGEDSFLANQELFLQRFYLAHVLYVSHNLNHSSGKVEIIFHTNQRGKEHVLHARDIMRQIEGVYDVGFVVIFPFL